MCMLCHEEAHDNPVSLDMPKASRQARAAEHGDGNPHCFRAKTIWFCVDCGEEEVDPKTHSCYE